MTRVHTRSLAGACLLALLTAAVTFAQTPTPVTKQQETPPARGARNPAGRGAGRPALPPLSPNMNQQQLAAYMDTYQLQQAERELQLNDEQFPPFVRRLRRLQDVKRRNQIERRKIIGELSGLVQGAAAPGRDENILGRLRALDDVSQRAAGELRKAYEELDAGLTPWQRGRFRLLEEQMERRKVELLGKIGAGG